MDTRAFWLLSRNHEVREIDLKTAYKLIVRKIKPCHIVYYHANGDLYSSQNYIHGKQLEQILKMVKGQRGEP